MGRLSRRGENVVLAGLTTAAALLGGAPLIGALTADATGSVTSPLPLDTPVAPASSTGSGAEVTTPAELEPSSATQFPTTQFPTTQFPTSLLPAPASSTGAASVRGATDIEHRGQAALARLDYPWQQRLPGWTIRFEPGRRGVLGLTHVDTRVIEIHVREGQSEALLAHVVAHEVGHAVDVTHNSSSDRRRWLDARGLDGSPWWPDEAAADFSTGAGDFAECFAAWQMGDEGFRSDLGGPPDASQLRLMAELAG